VRSVKLIEEVVKTWDDESDAKLSGESRRNLTVEIRTMGCSWKRQCPISRADMASMGRELRSIARTLPRSLAA
jgi:uncharacterized Fe-S cluster-containing MiaB family protein